MVEAQPRLWKSTLAIWALYALIILCEAVLTRGFFLAASADSAAFSGGLGPQNLEGVLHDVPNMMKAWTSGGFHPSHLESWERSSFPISGTAISAVALSFYLRKRRRSMRRLVA
jgi:hypothetical protein